MLYYLTKFHCLVTFTSWDIGQYVYCNYLLTWLWRHKFCSQLYLSNQAIPTWHKIQDKNLIILRMKRDFKMKWKSLFIILKALSMKQITFVFRSWDSDFNGTCRLISLFYWARMFINLIFFLGNSHFSLVTSTPHSMCWPFIYELITYSHLYTLIALFLVVCFLITINFC